MGMNQNIRGVLGVIFGLSGLVTQVHAGPALIDQYIETRAEIEVLSMSGGQIAGKVLKLFQNQTRTYSGNLAASAMYADSRSLQQVIAYAEQNLLPEHCHVLAARAIDDSHLRFVVVARQYSVRKGKQVGESGAQLSGFDSIGNVFSCGLSKI